MLTFPRYALASLNEFQILEFVKKANTLMVCFDTTPSMSNENLLGISFFDESGLFIASGLFLLEGKTGSDMCQRAIQCLEKQFQENWPIIASKIIGICSDSCPSQVKMNEFVIQQLHNIYPRPRFQQFCLMHCVDWNS